MRAPTLSFIYDTVVVALRLCTVFQRPVEDRLASHWQLHRPARVQSRAIVPLSIFRGTEECAGHVRTLLRYFPERSHIAEIRVAALLIPRPNCTPRAAEESRQARRSCGVVYSGSRTKHSACIAHVSRVAYKRAPPTPRAPRAF